MGKAARKATISKEELRARRKALGLEQQAALAELMGVDVMTVSRYESGAREIPYIFELALETVEARFRVKAKRAKKAGAKKGRAGR